MSDEVSVNSEELEAAASGFSDLARRVRNVYGTLLASLEGLGQPWGNDAAGNAFLNNYQDPKEQILTGLSGTGSVLDSTYDGLVTMAKGFADTEAENRQSINLGGGDSHPVV